MTSSLKPEMGSGASAPADKPGTPEDQSEQGLLALKSAVEAAPFRLSVLRPYARFLMKNLQFSQVRPIWERIAELAPDDVESRMAMARIFWRCGQQLDALDWLNAVLEKNPAHPDAVRLRSEITQDAVLRIAKSISSGNAAHAKKEIAALEQRLGENPDLKRLRKIRVQTRRRPAADRHPQRIESEDAAAEPPFAVSRDPPDELGEHLARWAALSDASPEGAAAALKREEARLLCRSPWLAQSIAQFHIGRGNSAAALHVFRSLPDSVEPETWVEAARYAVSIGRIEDAISFARKGMASSGPDTGMAKEFSRLLAGAGAADAAMAVWKELPGWQGNFEARSSIARLVLEGGRHRAFVEDVRAMLGDFQPLANLSESQQATIVELVRRARRSTLRNLRKSAAATQSPPGFAPPAECGLSHWVAGMLFAMQDDYDAALEHFERARRSSPLPSRLKIDLAAEIACLHARYHFYGAAYEAAGSLMKSATLPAEYETVIRRVKKAVEFSGWQAGLRFPENLMEVIFDEIREPPLRYEPRRGQILTVTASLRAGGSERQTVTVAGRMGQDERVSGVTLAIRSTASEEQQPFIVKARTLPIDIVTYGLDWKRKSDLAAQLPELSNRTRLAAALDLLPHNQHEEIVRLCKLIRERRPQAVHLRQDLFAGAIACRMAGVPRYFVHRGSLSPDLWGHGFLETNLHLRPMRHAYRRLLEYPEFSIVNNSTAGMESDIAWTGWSDRSKFRVIYNAVEFEQLGRDTGRDEAFRASAGIPADAFVVGGVFRIEAVKRPLLWIETARMVAAAHPNAHFVMLGDGKMAPQVRDYAQRHGFLDRLHMPGLVSDVGQWFRVFDLNLLTSEREGLPNVLIEGQHFGVPAVSSDVGGAFETVEPGVTGYLIPRDCGAEAFAETILKVMRDRAWLEMARARAPAFVRRKFGSQQTVNAVLEHLGLG
jgi:glycosyltransferase involved in cell wall biosynthesis/tetratricopeptide (TPR) repeat protein